MQDYNQAYSYILALTQQSPETAIVDFRLIHDTDKSVPAIKRRGTLPSLWAEIIDWQNHGYGCFVNVSEMDGIGNDLINVQAVRAHLADLDNIDAMAQLEMASKWSPPPTFGVSTSPGKAHIYWVVNPYKDNEYFTTLQRRIRQQFNGDPSVIDASRVARMPGTLHLKNPQVPYLVNCFALAGYGQQLHVQTLAASLQHVNVIEGHHGRKELGDTTLQAPSLEWLSFALSYLNPNDLDRGDWLSITAAFKQAGWNHADEQTLFNMWSQWCAQYNGNDPAENLKNWNSIRNSEIGWKSFRRRVPVLKAYEDFGYKEPPKPQQQPQPVPGGPTIPPQQPEAEPELEQQFGDILSEHECKSYFKNCFFVENVGKILTSRGRFMNATQFNGAYGGKLFVITPDGKTTDEPWKAATRSTLWTVPKVDHVRFLPTQKTFDIVEDQLGRRGVNTYIPIRLKHRRGDVTPFLRHMELMLPVEADRQLIYAFLAHNVKYPGVKVPWAPMIQSAEGVGKGFIKKVIEGMLGEMYTYSPPATELIGSSATFNSWQRNKLMIVVDEIKIDERRELIEIMKPWIGDDRIQIQSKGENQEMEDNPANYCFFSNYKDAIPLVSSGRRYAIFYSIIQSVDDLLIRGMDDNYFNALFQWRENGGQEHIVDWLLNYPVEKRWLMRAPKTSSYQEAIKVSRGPLEICIANGIEDGLPGFRGGYVSTIAVVNRAKQLGIRSPSQATVQRVLEAMGYSELGRAVRQHGQESMVERTTVYGCLPGLPVEGYGRAQGYGE